MRIGLLAGLLLLLLPSGCVDDEEELLVDLRTDLVPGEEFDEVVTVVTAPGVREIRSGALPSGDYFAGERIADIAGLGAGEYAFEVRLLESGAVLSRRPVRVRVEGRVGVTVVMPRDCVGVMCPAPGDDPVASACLFGLCGDPACTPENPSACEASECEADADCVATAACASPSCAAGACLFTPRAGACDAGQGCDPDLGCVPVSATALDDLSPPAEIGLALGGRADDPTVTGDLLELHFCSTARGGPDIYRAVRSDPSAPWPTPELVAELSTDGWPEGDPAISLDGLHIWFASDRAALGSFDIYRSSRASRSDPWSTPALVREISSPESEVPSWVSADLLTLFITANRATENAVYVSTRPDTDSPWSAPTEVSDVDNPAIEEGHAVLWDRDLRIVFEYQTPVGMNDLLRASRPSTADRFGTSMPLDGLNSPGLDTDPWVAPDGRYLVFASDRMGEVRLYEAVAR